MAACALHRSTTTGLAVSEFASARRHPAAVARARRPSSPDRTRPAHRTCAPIARAVERRDDGLHLECRHPASHGDGAERQLAAAAERDDERAFGGEGRCRAAASWIAPASPRVASSSLRISIGNDTLTRGRNALVDGHRRRDPPAEAEAAQARAGEHQRVETRRHRACASRVSTLPRIGANVAPG